MQIRYKNGDVEHVSQEVGKFAVKTGLAEEVIPTATKQPERIPNLRLSRLIGQAKSRGRGFAQSQATVRRESVRKSSGFSNHSPIRVFVRRAKSRLLPDEFSKRDRDRFD
jgi:hypothetical protein